MLKRPVVTVVLLVVLLAAGAFFSLRGGKEMTILGDSGAPPLQFYTSPGVTTPQLAFWSAYKNGDLKSFLPLAVNYWKDLDQLKTLVVAGKGDLWLGHLEGFALARRLGAPVKVIAVSGWRKFYFLSRDDSIQSPEDLAGKLAELERRIEGRGAEDAVLPSALPLDDHAPVGEHFDRHVASRESSHTFHEVPRRDCHAARLLDVGLDLR